MNETQRRIKAYKAALPGLRERVIAVALLLAMSVAMMTSATFAWLTISRAPEVTGASTTVAANGNLEIALSKADGTAPDESKVGDSSAREGQSVANANLTWGNLVNISDPSYGLDKVVLRPAKLGSGDLLAKPLVGVFYGTDGRAESNYNRDFAFTSWNSEQEFFEFSAVPRYGVRAISTIEYKIQDSTLKDYRTLFGLAETARDNTHTEYRKIIGNDVPAGNDPENHNNNIKVIAKMLGAFISEGVMGDVNTLDCAVYIKDLYNMVLMMEDAYASVGDALASMANVQVFVKYGKEEYQKYLYNRFDLVTESDTDGKYAANTERLTKDGVKLVSLNQYVADLNTLKSIKTDLKPFYDKVIKAEEEMQTVQILWPEIETVVNKLVVISTCTVQEGENGTPLRPSQIGMTAAMNMLNSTNLIGTINSGLIVNYEQLSGEMMHLQKVKVQTTIGDMSVTLKEIRTSAKAPGLIDQDLENNCQMEGSDANLQGSDQDTYGLALDVWVRTNTEGVALILEGNVLTEPVYELATMTIPGGQTVALYTATVTYPKSETEEGSGSDDMGDKVDQILGNNEKVDVYQLEKNVLNDKGQKTEEKELVWHFADTHAEVYKRNADYTISEIPNRFKDGVQAESIIIPSSQKVNESYKVIGYYGENRVWEDAKPWEENAMLNISSTTQGSGSCYVFYSDNPTDQENSLKLLSNLRVAFLDEEGELLAKAKLDTENHYATPGKVIIPLVLLVDADVTNPTYTGDDIAIISLTKNEAVRLTMVVYLDGTDLSNDQVLAANDIQGKLNIQFGSSVSLNTIGDEVLETAELHVSATVKDGETEFDYDAQDDMTTHVTVNVDGINPATVKAYFIRQVNATQGSREPEPIVFEEKGNGVYEGAYTFTTPGIYILRSVELDGQEYELEGGYPKVTVKGFAMSSVVCSGCTAGEITSVLTGDNSITRAVSVSFMTDDREKMPDSVQVQFVNNDGGDPVTVLMSYNSYTSSFEGNAVFNRSGSYTMKYVIMDGKYVDLGRLGDEDTSDQLITLDITLGVYVQIADEVDWDRTEYKGESIAVPVLAQIYNEIDQVLSGLQNVKLYYAKEGTVLDAPDTNLSWNPDRQLYTGELQLAKPGKYAFNYVLVGENLINKTKGKAPEYTVISPDPVVYVKGEDAFTAGYQFMSNSNSKATMAIRLGYAESATVYAVMENTVTGTRETVLYSSSADKGTDINGMPIREFVFEIPSTTQYGQDGTWKIVEIQMADVCDENQQYYDDSRRLVWTMATDEDQVSDTIQTRVQTLVFDVRGDANTDAQTTYATKADGTAYVFMDQIKADRNAYFVFADRLGNALDPSIVISDVKAVYTYKENSSKDYGGYEADHLKVSIDTEYKLTQTDSKTYTLPAGSVKLDYAGEYNCTLISYKINGTEYAYYQGSVHGAVDADMPSYIFQTTKPTLSILSISPKGQHNTVTESKKNKTVTSQVVGNKITIYPDSEISSDGCSGSLKAEPTVTLRLTGLGNATKAILTFTCVEYDTVRLYYGKSSKEGTNTDSFIWDSSTGTDVARFVGYNDAGSCDDSEPAGTLNSNAYVEFVFGEYTYRVPVNAITIENIRPA